MKSSKTYQVIFQKNYQTIHKVLQKRVSVSSQPENHIQTQNFTFVANETLKIDYFYMLPTSEKCSKKYF